MVGVTGSIPVLPTTRKLKMRSPTARTAVHAPPVCRFLWIFLAFSAPVLAGVGASSSGVTTTTGNSTDPSADVQSQSAGFVQQNQQLQNGGAPNAAAASGTSGAQPGTVSGANAGAGAASADAAGAGNGAAAAGTTAAPAVPPAPPPVYESTMRRLDRRAEPPPMTIVASGAAGAERKADGAPSTAVQPDAAPSIEPPPAAPRIEQASAAKTAAAGHPNPPATAPAERTTVPPAVTGGRGTAPDGFTFYSGLTIAGALLAFGFFTFMRLGRNEGMQ